MRFPKLFTYLLLAALLFSVSCAGGKSVSGNYGSIFDRGYQLPVSAERYEEYEWNADSRKAYELFLQIMNNHYFRKDYQSSSVFFYDAIDLYRYDARFYIRLAESLARIRDIQRANEVLSEGGRRIPGLTSHPGYMSYLQELQNNTGITEAEPEPKGIIGKTVSIVTWPFRWPYNKIKSLF